MPSLTPPIQETHQVQYTLRATKSGAGALFQCWACSARREGFEGQLVSAFQCLPQHYQEDGARLFTVVHNGKVRQQ